MKQESNTSSLTSSLSFHVFRMRLLVALGMLLADVLAIIVSAGLSWLIRLPFLGALPLKNEVNFLIGYVLAFCALNLLQGLYEPIGMPIEDRVRRLSVSNLFLGLGTAFIFFAMKIGSMRSRTFYILLWLALFLIGPIMRIAVRKLMIHLNLWGLPVGVLGTDKDQVRSMLDYMESHPDTGLRPTLVCIKGASFQDLEDEDSVVTHEVLGRIPLLKEEEFRKTLKEGDFTTLVAFGNTVDVLDHVRKDYRACVWDIVAFGDPGSRSEWHGVEFCQYGSYYGLAMNQPLLRHRGQLIKRWLDIVLCTLGLIVISPIFLLLMLLVRLSGPGPVFFLQDRRGKGGKTFGMLKFRTMVDGASEKLEEMLDSDPSLRAEWDEYQKLTNDPRVTGIGKFLRRTSLDELPQLLNIIKGDMSLVGPRPIVCGTAVEQYGPLIEYCDLVLPGLTGLWQISGRNECSIEDHAFLDYQYIMTWSIWKDIVILFATPAVVILGKTS